MSHFPPQKKKMEQTSPSKFNQVRFAHLATSLRSIRMNSQIGILEMQTSDGFGDPRDPGAKDVWLL